MTTQFDVMNLRYSAISGKASYLSRERELRKKSWEMWEPFWRDIYASVGSEYKPNPDDFLRQDIIHVLEHNEKVVGLLCSSFYDLTCEINQRHSYMKFYNLDFFQHLIKADRSQTMTFEYLSLHPDFRKSKINLALAPILFRCGIEFFKQSRADSMIVTARNDVKVNEILYGLGFHAVQEKTLQRNFECDLIALFKEDCRDLRGQEQSIFQTLWKERFQSEMIYPFVSAGHRSNEKLAG